MNISASIAVLMGKLLDARVIRFVLGACSVFVCTFHSFISLRVVVLLLFQTFIYVT